VGKPKLIRFNTVNGKKTKFGKDKLLIINTFHTWHIITNEEILYIIDFIFKNEDRIYPQSANFDGRDIFFQEIKKVYYDTKK
jgi:hypothetical protein